MDKKLLGRSLLCALGCALLISTSAQQTPFSTEKENPLTDPNTLFVGDDFTNKRLGMSKVSNALLRFSDERQAFMSNGGSGDFKSRNGAIHAGGGFVTVDAIAVADASALESELAALGATGIVSYKNIVSAQVPVDAIYSMQSLSNLRYVRPFYAATNVGDVTTLGDEAQRSDEARTTFSVDGTGIKVGILSDSYDCLSGEAAGIASGDLPNDVVVLEEINSCGGAIDEGRGMAELVYDVAPGSDLSFHSAFNGVAGFASGIGELVADGADVVVDDVIYFAELMFQDGPIAQAADDSYAAGVPYFSSAGNSDVGSYESVFVDSGLFGFNGGKLHDFDPSAGVDVFQSITVPFGGSFFMSMQWAQSSASASPGAPGAFSDLDVFIVGADGVSILGGALANNIGNDAVEVFQFVNSGFDLDGNPGADTEFFVAIENFSGPNPELIKYVINGSASIDEYDTQSGTSYGHANAAGASSVAAAFFYFTPEFGTDPAILESFSSRGDIPIYFEPNGTVINPPERRLNPMFTAPDGGNTTFFGQDSVTIPAIGEPDGFPNFFGTSAAAPHAAAVAALMLEVDPTLTPDEVYRALENSALDMSTPGYDFDSGFGLIQADAAISNMSFGAPSLDAISSIEIDTADGAVVIPLNSTDPDGDNITLSVTDLPSFCTSPITDNGDGTGSISCNASDTDIGRFSVTATATDDGATPQSHSRGFYIFANINDAPVLDAVADQTINEGQQFQVTLNATDPNGDSLTYFWPYLLPFCTFNVDTLTCNPGFTDEISTATRVSVIDDGTPQLADSQTFQITVNNVNRAPVLASIGNRSVDENANLAINLSATDPDPDNLTFGTSGLPGFCSLNDNLNGTGTINCAPTFADSGAYNVTITVDDNSDNNGVADNLTDQESIQITVNDVNQPPTITPISEQSTSVNDVLVIPVNSSDGDGNQLTLSESGLPGFCSLNDAGDGTGDVTCSPTQPGDIGEYAITITTTDNGTPNLNAQTSFTLIVSAQGSSNTRPVLNPIGNLAASLGNPLNVVVSASDADGDQLSFDETGFPGFCSLTDNGNGTADIDCNPQNGGDVGTYPVNVEVTDDGSPNLSDDEDFSIEVLSTDNPPTADAGPDQSVSVSAVVNLDGTGSFDAEGPVQFRWRFTKIATGSSATDASITNGNTATPSFTADERGEFRLEVIVTDSGGQTDSDEVVITVTGDRTLYALDRGDGSFSNLVELDPADGSVVNFVQISVPGETVTGGYALAVDPTTNIMYAGLRLQGVQNRVLVTLDVNTGVATQIGDMGERIAGFAFDDDGTLYAVSGDGSPTPETLFTVDKTTGALTLVQALGNGADGEAIAYNPNNGLMYHGSGFSPTVFETVNLDNGTVTDVGFTGAGLPNASITSLEWDPARNAFIGAYWDFVTTGQVWFFTIDTSGNVTDIAQMALLARGMTWWDPAFRTVTESMVLRRTTDLRWFGYELSGAEVIERGKIPLTRSPDYSVVSRADFNADGKPDLLVRDLVGGQNGRWVMAILEGPRVVSEGFADLTRNDVWQIVATRDFDGDNKADVLLRNTSDGRWLLYLMDSRVVIEQGVLGGMSTNLTDTYQGSGDFNGDGRTDILLRRADGTWVAYLLDGLNAPTEINPSMTPNTAFTVQAIADRNGDGRADVLLRRNDGRWFLYLLDGETIIDSGAPAMSENTDFVHVASADFNGDGNIDVLLRRSDGRWFMYMLNGISILDSGNVDMTNNTAFGLVVASDHNNDGNADALLRRSDGRWALYTLDGTTIVEVGIPDMTKNTSWVPYPAQQ